MSLSRVEELPEGTVAWDVVGEGPPVVLVHGFPARGDLWRDVAPALARAGRRVHVYDLLGMGGSEQREDQQVYFEGQARVLAALVRRWGLERPAVVAHDMGTGAAVTAVTRLGMPVERLALLSAAISPPVVTGSTQHVRAHLEAYASMPAATWEPLVRAKIATATRVPMDPVTLEGYVRPWLGERGQAAYLRLVTQIDEDLVAATYAAVSGLDVPVAVLWGEEDTWLPVEQARPLAERIPGADLHVVAGAGHFLPEDAPGAVARLLRAWC